MKRYFIKKIVLSIGTVFIVIVSASILMPIIFGENYIENKYLYNGFLRLVFLLGTLYVLKREKLINWNYTHKNIIGSLLVSSMLIYLSWRHAVEKIAELKIKVSNYDHFFYTFNCLATGFFEEYFFRILIFVYVCKIFSGEDNNFKPVLWTSFLFAIVHITGFLTGLTDIVSAITQIMFAFLTGIILQSIFCRFNNIFTVSILHAVINYNGMMNQKLFKIERHSDDGTFYEIIIQILIPFILIGLFVSLPVAYLTFKKRVNYLIKH